MTDQNVSAQWMAFLVRMLTMPVPHDTLIVNQTLKYGEEILKWTPDDFTKAGLPVDEPEAVLVADISVLVQKIPAVLSIVPAQSGCRVTVLTTGFTLQGFFHQKLIDKPLKCSGALYYISFIQLLRTRTFTLKIANGAIMLIFLDDQKKVVGVFSGPVIVLPYTAVSGYAEGIAKDA